MGKREHIHRGRVKAVGGRRIRAQKIMNKANGIRL